MFILIDTSIYGGVSDQTRPLITLSRVSWGHPFSIMPPFLESRNSVRKVPEWTNLLGLDHDKPVQPQARRQCQTARPVIQSGRDGSNPSLRSNPALQPVSNWLKCDPVWGILKDLRFKSGHPRVPRTGDWLGTGDLIM